MRRKLSRIDFVKVAPSYYLEVNVGETQKNSVRELPTSKKIHVNQ